MDISSDEDIPTMEHTDCSDMISNLFSGLMSGNNTFESVKPMNRATPGSAGYELYSQVDVDVQPGETVLVETGVSLMKGEGEERVSILPPGWWLNIRTKSRHAAWGRQTVDDVMRTFDSITILAGVVDSDFTGTIKVMVHNLSRTNVFRVKKGDAIAQAILCQYHTFSNEVVLSHNTNHAGLGSTG